MKHINLIKTAIDFFDIGLKSKVDFTTKGEKVVYVDGLKSSLIPRPKDGMHNRYDVIINASEEKASIQELHFQNGSPAEGINGMSNEIALAAVLHRLTKQNESYPSPYNTLAIYAIEVAISALHMRLSDRKDFGIYDKPEVVPPEEVKASLFNSLSIVNCVGLLTNALIKFDITYNLNHPDALVKHIENISAYGTEFGDPEKEEVTPAVALMLTSSAVIGTGIFRGLWNVAKTTTSIGRKFSKDDSEKTSEDNSANNAE